MDVRENPIVQTTGHTTSMKARYFETVCAMFDKKSQIFKPSLLVKPGWWYTYFSEKYKFVSWGDYFIPLFLENHSKFHGSKPPARNTYY